MNFTKEQVDDANQRLITNPALASRLSDSIAKLAYKSTVGPGTYQAHVPDEFATAHVDARLKAAQRTVRAAGSMAERLLILESQLEEFTSLSERKEAWVGEQNKLAFDMRRKADMEARARAVASQWQTNGAGSKLTAIVVNAERELLALRGCLALGADLTAWEADALSIARRFAAQITEAVASLKQPSEAA